MKSKTILKMPKFGDWQNDALKLVLEHDKESFIIMKSRRQTGKSTTIKMVLLHFAINKPKSINFSLSPTFGQSRKLYLETKVIIEKTGILKRYSDSRLELEFINGSSIKYISAGQKESISGITTKGILCIDEAYNVSDEVFLRNLIPTLNVNKSSCFIVSTPRYKQGFFYDYYLKGLQGKDKCYSIDVNDYDTSLLLSNETLERYRKMYPKDQFMTEFLGEFMDGDSIVFGDFKPCIIKGKYDYDINDIYIGIDWGGGTGNDYTSISFMNKNFEQFRRESFNDISPVEQIDRICDLFKDYGNKIKCIVLEKNSIGNVYGSMLRSKLLKNRDFKSTRIVDFTTSNNSKKDLVDALQVLIQNDGIRLLDDKVQTIELSSYEAKIDPKTNTVSYNGKLGTHDDSVISLLLSIYALQKYGSGNRNKIY